MVSKFSLMQYSAAALALLSAKAAYSQAVYTDIDPDVILDEPGESFGIDLDDDGLNDFNFFNKSFTTTVWNGAQGEISAIFAGAFDNMENGLVGYIAYYSGYGGTTYFRPHALSENFSVNEYINFYNANYQTVAMIIYEPDFPPTTIRRGDWYPLYGYDITNHFLGFRFEDESSNKRYGWIRCSVIDSGRTLIIHDYAYESKPDTPILTGDTIGDTTTVNIQEGEFSGLTVYSFGNSVFINTPLNKVQYRILNLQGEVILNGQVTSGSYKLDLNTAATGVYLVECRKEKIRKTFKVFIEN
jgi:hypothetical protein